MNIFTGFYLPLIQTPLQRKCTYKQPMLATGRGTNVRTKLHYNKQLKSNSLHGYITNVHKTYKCLIETTGLNGKRPITGTN